MTRSSQKEGERFFVEIAAKSLGKDWSIDQDCEHPDFIVTEGAQQFGLEVCEIFTGKQGTRGADRKREESKTQKFVNSLQRKYESEKNIPLSVRFVGDKCDESMAAVVQPLLDEDFANKPFGHHRIIEVDNGRAGIRVHVTRALRANWISVNDRAGWVDFNAKERIAKEIEKKSEKLPRYMECASSGDIRLLIVANRIMNSGKLSLRGQPALDVRGFRAVYFLSYPKKKVTVFN